MSFRLTKVFRGFTQFLQAVSGRGMPAPFQTLIYYLKIVLHVTFLKCFVNKPTLNQSVEPKTDQYDTKFKDPIWKLYAGLRETAATLPFLRSFQRQWVRKVCSWSNVKFEVVAQLYFTIFSCGVGYLCLCYLVRIVQTRTEVSSLSKYLVVTYKDNN